MDLTLFKCLLNRRSLDSFPTSMQQESRPLPQWACLVTRQRDTTQQKPLLCDKVAHRFPILALHIACWAAAASDCNAKEQLEERNKGMAVAGGAILLQVQVPLGNTEDQGIFNQWSCYRTRKTHLGHSSDVRRKAYEYRLQRSEIRPVTMTMTCTHPESEGGEDTICRHASFQIVNFNKKLPSPE